MRNDEIKWINFDLHNLIVERRSVWDLSKKIIRFTALGDVK